MCAYVCVLLYSICYDNVRIVNTKSVRINMRIVINWPIVACYYRAYSSNVTM